MKFNRVSQSVPNEERLLLATLVKKYKDEYDKEVENNKNKTKWDYKRKKHVAIKPKGGYVAKAVRELYTDLTNVKNDDPIFVRALKVASRAFNDLDELNDSSLHPPKKTRGTGGGRKAKAPEVREALFSWFINIRESLKGRLPKKLFKLKAQSLYSEWLKENHVEPDEQLKFSNPWMAQWQNEYGVSLKKPNKRYTLKLDELKTRLQDYLQNVWYVRRYFMERFGVDPPIINGDQMPLHRNESSDQKTLAFKHLDTYVKENHMLSRDRITVFTQVSSSQSVQLRPEFVFKGKGVRTKVDVPGVKYQWSESGSYRLEHMLQTIKNLPNRFNPFTHKGFAIYVLDDYAVHLMPDVRKALWARGYILILIGGGITGYIQVNDTHVHHHLKANYREEESRLMLEMLSHNPEKVPAPSREKMVSMVNTSWDKLDSNFSTVFKTLFITSKLDGSEDYLVSDRLMNLIGPSMKQYREELLKSDVPSTIQSVIKNLIPPKGIKRNFEGHELLPPPEIEDDEGNEADPDSTDSEDDEHRDVNEPSVDDGAFINPVNNTNDAGTRVLLAGNCVDNEIQKDAIFLDKLGDLFEEYETSNIFMPHFKRIKRANDDARRSVRKRILNERHVENLDLEIAAGDYVEDADEAGPSNDDHFDAGENDEFTNDFSDSDVDDEDVAGILTTTRSGRAALNWRAAQYL